MTPDTHTISETMFDVGQGHQLYVQEWGNKKAKTTFMFLHGGPGSGCNDSHKLLFNPHKNRVIFFDQRGSGKSLPAGELKDNTTEHCINDIQVIANKFDLKTFVLVGGSWGSTLALAYGIAYPKTVQAMVLRGIFTGRQEEIEFLSKGGFRHFYPDVWERFAKSVPKEHQDSPSAYHGPRALGDNQKIAKESAYAYEQLEGSIMKLDDRYQAEEFEEFDPSGIRIEILYMQNKCFLSENHIFDNANKLTMPIWLVQGRYDAVCPPTIAYELHKKLPDSQLLWTLAGHGGGERANFDSTKTIIGTFA